MSSSPSPTSPAIPSSSSSADSPPPPSSLSPPPISNSPPPFSSPPVPSAPSPTPPSPSSPPPAFSPPSSPTSPPVTPPPPDLSSPPVTPPPPDLSSPPVTPPPPDLTSPLPSSPPAASTPPPSSPPAASPPPPPTPAVSPPPITPPPPPIEAKPTPTLTPPPPPSPNASAPPPPDRTSSPTPNAASPPPPSVSSSPQIPIASPPPPHLPGKPTGTSPPPPAADSPKSSPSPPPQEMSRSPPSVPSAPPPKSTLPPPRTTPPPPANSSGGATTPSPVQASSPVPSTNLPDNSTNPIPENTNSSNSFAPASGVPGNSTSGGGTTNTAAAVSIGLAAVFVLLCSLGLAVWFVRRRRKSVAGYAAGFVMPSPLTSSIMSESPHPRSPTAPLIYHHHHHHHHKSGSVGSEAGIVSAQSPFSYDELFAITNGFSPQNILGEGGFGCVYKGCLPDGREVAVKQLKVGSGQGEREFKAEVEIISRVHHRHLVSLVGYCISENQRLLVYDFVPNGTLDSHIHGKGKAVLDWPTRVKVATGAARGIAYLHEDCHPRIIHRDIKSSNILLDNNFEAQVSDFGLARLAMDCKTHVTTRVIGTFGYLAPEYASSGKLTDRSDVYSFGVVLLELITGRKPVDDSQPMGDESLVEWARPRLTHALETRDFGELPDSRLEKNYNEMEMLRVVEAAAACIRQSAAVRPQMGKVVRILDALADADLTNGVKPRQSEVSDGRELSELRLLQRLAFGSQVFASEHSHSSWSGQSDI